MTFRKIDFPCGKLEVKWYLDECKTPVFKSVYSIGFQIREIGELKNENDSGQKVNPARSQGIDYNNVNTLQYSFVNQGVDTSIMPPIILPDGTVIDGNNRVEAYRQIGAQYVVVYCVELNEGFTVDDVYDEVGLGMNNHLVSKPMTLKDCKIRLQKYSNRTDQFDTTKGIEWFKTFNHSFSDKEIADAVKTVIQGKRVSDTMSPYCKKTVSQYIKRRNLDANTTMLPLNVNIKDSRSYMHYFCRGVIEVVDTYNKTGKLPELIGFLSNCEAEDADNERQKMNKLVDEYNKKFNNILMLYKAAETDGQDFKLLKLEKWMGQVTNVETEIINVNS